MLDLGLPVAGRLVEDAGTVQDPAPLWVTGRKDQAPNPGLGDGACAHGAGLEGDKEAKSRQAIIGAGEASGSEGQDLGVGGGVAEGNRRVFAFRNHLAGGGINKNSANRRLFGVRGVLRKPKGSAHGVMVMIDHRRHGAQNSPQRQAPTLETPAKGPEIVSDAATAAGERVAKALARAGVASRREVERYIAEGRVAVNGKPLTGPAVKIEAGDILTVDGQVVNEREPTRLWRYHKSVGLLTTHSDPGGRPTVFENLPKGLPRVISIGRLDLNSEGLLLLTNDGALARALELPKSGWIRRYRVRAFGRTDQAKLDKLKAGVTVEGVAYGPIEARLDKVTRTESTGGANLWITVAIAEGKNREVRRVMESLGLKVNRLIRLAYGPFALTTLPVGAVEEVGPRVIRELLADFIPPESMPKGDRAGGLLLPAGGVKTSRRPGAAGASPGGGEAAKAKAPEKPKKVYKAGWAKPSAPKIAKMKRTTAARAAKPAEGAGASRARTQPDRPSGRPTTSKPRPKSR